MALDAFDDLLGLTPPSVTSDIAAPITAAPNPGRGDVAMGGGFDAADRYDQALNMWQSPIQSADADILPDKEMIDGRARDMLRNDAFVQGGANLHKDNIVGAQYLLNTRPSSRVIFGKEDDTWESEFQEEVEEKFDLCAESPDNWFDAQRTNSFTALVRLAVGIHLAGGEVLAAVEWLKNGRPFNTAIQMLDLDRLSDPRDRVLTPAERRNLRGGISFDEQGAPKKYWIQTAHPSDIWLGGTMELPKWKDVAIRKPWGRLQVIHIHEQVRPDQSRGVPEMAAALKEMRISKRFRDVQLQRAVMQSMYAAAITSELPSAEVFARMGGGAIDAKGAQAAVTAYATGFLQAISKYAGSAQNMRLDGVRIPHFFPGTKLEMLSPTTGQAIGQEFEQSLLRYIASSIGVSYEQLSRDYTNTNYSSARAAMTETWKFMQARKKLVADRFASLIYRLWLEEQINKGEIFSFPKRKAGLLYTDGALNLRFDAIARCEWVGASRGQIDELKETQAAVLRINNGLSTAEDELARLGRDWRKVYRQLKREQALRETLGLLFVGSDPQVMAAMASAAHSSANDTPENRKEAA